MKQPVRNLDCICIKEKERLEKEIARNLYPLSKTFVKDFVALNEIIVWVFLSTYLYGGIC